MRIFLRTHELKNNGAMYALIHYAEYLARTGHHLLLSVPPGGEPALRERFQAAGIEVNHETDVDAGGFDLAIVITALNGRAVEVLSKVMPVVWSITESRAQAPASEQLLRYFACASKIVFPSYRMIVEYADILMASAPYIADVIPIGFEPVDYPPWQERGDGVFRILCVGSLYPRKRQVDLINAVRRLADPAIRCVFAGDRYAMGEADLGYAREHPEQFSFVHPESREELRTLYRQCDMFALASSDETFGLAPIEAGQAELPVVLSNLPAYRYLWRDGRNALLFPVADVGALAAAIKRLKEDPALRRQLGRRAREVAQSLPFELYARRFDTTLADALARAEIGRST